MEKEADGFIIFLYFLGSFLGIVVFAAIFGWVTGINKLSRRSKAMLDLVTKLAEKQGVTKEEIAVIERVNGINQD